MTSTDQSRARSSPCPSADGRNTPYEPGWSRQRHEAGTACGAPIDGCCCDRDCDRAASCALQSATTLRLQRSPGGPSSAIAMQDWHGFAKRQSEASGCITPEGPAPTETSATQCVDLQPPGRRSQLCALINMGSLDLCTTSIACATLDGILSRSLNTTSCATRSTPRNPG